MAPARWRTGGWYPPPVPYADVDDQRIYVEDTAWDGPPVILAHRFVMDHEMFAEALAAGLPGCDGVVKVGGAHAANLINPVPVHAAIRDFLAGLPA